MDRRSNEKGGSALIRCYIPRARRFFLICYLLAQWRVVAAQLPGSSPLFPLSDGRRFGLDVQPEHAAYHVFFHTESERGFTALGQLISITSHTESSGMLMYSLPIDSMWNIRFGWGVQVHSWSQPSNLTHDFPVLFQVNRTVSKDAELVAFVRVINRGQLLDVQDRGEFDGGIQWMRRHHRGVFSASWSWAYPRSWLEFYWLWLFEQGNMVRFRMRPAPLSLGGELGLARGKKEHWIGVTYSNVLGLWLWNWRMNFRK